MLAPLYSTWRAFPSCKTGCTGSARTHLGRGSWGGVGQKSLPSVNRKHQPILGALWSQVLAFLKVPFWKFWIELSKAPRFTPFTAWGRSGTGISVPEVVEWPAGGGGGGGGGGGNAEDSPVEEKEGQCSTFPLWARAEWTLGRLNVLRGAKTQYSGCFQTNLKKKRKLEAKGGFKGCISFKWQSCEKRIELSGIMWNHTVTSLPRVAQTPLPADRLYLLSTQGKTDLHTELGQTDEQSLAASSHNIWRLWLARLGQQAPRILLSLSPQPCSFTSMCCAPCYLFIYLFWVPGIQTLVLMLA